MKAESAHIYTYYSMKYSIYYRQRKHTLTHNIVRYTCVCMCAPTIFSVECKPAARASFRYCVTWLALEWKCLRWIMRIIQAQIWSSIKQISFFFIIHNNTTGSSSSEHRNCALMHPPVSYFCSAPHPNWLLYLSSSRIFLQFPSPANLFGYPNLKTLTHSHTPTISDSFHFHHND